MRNPDKIIRTSRKTLAIQISRDGEVIVRSPLKTTEEEIARFVLKCQQWIETHTKKVENRRAQIPVETLNEGSTVTFMGTKYPITFADVSTVSISDMKILLPKSALEQNLTEAWIVWWLKNQAKAHFSKRVQFFANRMGETYNEVKISPAHSRWGSCSSNRNLNFAWRLILCPPDVIDYVIVHELSHLKHMNHSKDFWKRVHQFLPTYEIREHWLKQNGALLNWLEKW